jgi:RHH-type proline utilization regulon transcriptional repressor/proline dehydrogenase/delta 1-pyrroline-5-carboxylate dehydrogenase
MSLIESSDTKIEFQRLYGMGELLYSACQDLYKHFPETTIYCPIGRHKELLPYLVRRLLENGANSSFINKYLNNSIPVMDLALNPGDKIKEKIDHLDISNLTLPRNLYLPRLNSDGFDLNEMDCIETLMSKVNKFSESNFHAYSISSQDLPKNLPIEIISKCNKKIIGIIETCNLESA